MTEPDGQHSREQQSFWHRRIPRVRYVYSAGAIVGGIVLVVQSLGGSADGSPLALGGFLLLLGLLSIPLYWWMDKRGL